MQNQENQQDQQLKRRRRSKRMPLTMPAQVKFQSSQSGAWEEIIRLTSVSMLGAGMVLSRKVNVGTLLQLTLSLPAELRFFDQALPQYNIWAIVRYVVPKYNPISPENSPKAYEIGVAFVGKNPPESFLKDPYTTYDIQGVTETGLWKVTESTAARNDADRDSEVDQGDNLNNFDTSLRIPYNILIEAMEPDGSVSAMENTITETISSRNACVYSSLPLTVGRTVRFNCPEMKTTIICRVTAVDAQQNGFTRMRLEFVDRTFPLQGFEERIF
jgi:hypothetical protein